jgi:hypothetical protein
MVKTLSPDKQALTIYVTHAEYDSIQNAADNEQRSLSSWCKLTLLAKIQGTKAVLGNLAPGETVIIQKRGKHGTFESKNKRDGGK